VEKLVQRDPCGMAEYRSYERMKGEFWAVPTRIGNLKLISKLEWL